MENGRDLQDGDGLSHCGLNHCMRLAHLGIPGPNLMVGHSGLGNSLPCRKTLSSKETMQGAETVEAFTAVFPSDLLYTVHLLAPLSRMLLYIRVKTMKKVLVVAFWPEGVWLLMNKHGNSVNRGFFQLCSITVYPVKAKRHLSILGLRQKCVPGGSLLIASMNWCTRLS